MCEYCRKFTQRAYSLKEGYDIFIGYKGEAFIDLFNNLVIHTEKKDADEPNEIALPIKYCPWCGKKLEVVKK